MNYNKLFLISFSLIYSANVFSNTDSPLPTDNPSQLGNGSMVESSVDIPPTSTTHLPQPPLMPHLPQPPLMRDRAPTIGNTSGYMSRFPYTFI
ncbi:adhesin, partial [Proteus mirabilis]|nr:adhesin [Proteus mirabilis]